MLGKFKENYMITMKDIIEEGNPILRKQLSEVSLPLTKEDEIVLECMMQFLRNSQDPQIAAKFNLRAGVGLSANQIGLDKKMFVALFHDDTAEQQAFKLINPKIISHSANIIFLPEGEGCLSVNRTVPGHVPRYERIKVKAFNEFGEEKVYNFKGYRSIVMQHEIDHLNGIMFYDRIDPAKPFIMK